MEAGGGGANSKQGDSAWIVRPAILRFYFLRIAESQAAKLASPSLLECPSRKVIFEVLLLRELSPAAKTEESLNAPQNRLLLHRRSSSASPGVFIQPHLTLVMMRPTFGQRRGVIELLKSPFLFQESRPRSLQAHPRCAVRQSEEPSLRRSCPASSATCCASLAAEQRYLDVPQVDDKH
jgi:hypothetical protein